MCAWLLWFGLREDEPRRCGAETDREYRNAERRVRVPLGRQRAAEGFRAAATRQKKSLGAALEFV